MTKTLIKVFEWFEKRNSLLCCRIWLDESEVESETKG